jgi:hypothetical protein
MRVRRYVVPLRTGKRKFFWTAKRAFEFQACFQETHVVYRHSFRERA